MNKKPIKLISLELQYEVFVMVMLVVLSLIFGLIETRIIPQQYVGLVICFKAFLAILAGYICYLLLTVNNFSNKLGGLFLTYFIVNILYYFYLYYFYEKNYSFTTNVFIFTILGFSCLRTMWHLIFFLCCNMVVLLCSEFIYGDFSLQTYSVFLSLSVANVLGLIYSWKQFDLKETMHNQELIYKLISDNSNDLILVFDSKKQRITYSTMNVSKYLEYQDSEILSVPISKLFSTPDFENYMSLIKANASTSTFSTEFQLFTKSNRPIWMTLKDVSVGGYAEEEYHVVILNDIEEVKQRENQLQSSIKKLMANNQQLSTSNFELKNFTSVASHDLKEPLRSISSHLSYIKENHARSLNDEASTELNMALEGANKMTNLINNVLKYSRMGGSAFNLELKSMEYSVRNVTSALSAKIRDTNALIYMSNLPEIKCDSHQIEQMLQNIIDNSIKYSKPNERPVILIQAYERQDDWLFCVADNGIGMNLEDGIEELFQPFKRLENTKNIDGSGIGLAICKKAVTNHGGKIWIESELGKGSTFYFTISKYLNVVPNNVA